MKPYPNELDVIQSDVESHDTNSDANADHKSPKYGLSDIPNMNEVTTSQKLIRRLTDRHNRNVPVSNEDSIFKEIEKPKIK